MAQIKCGSCKRDISLSSDPCSSMFYVLTDEEGMKLINSKQNKSYVRGGRFTPKEMIKCPHCSSIGIQWEDTYKWYKEVEI